VSVVDGRHGVPNTVSVGGIDKGTLLQSLRAQHVALNHAAEILFADHRFTVGSQQRTLGIACLCVADLGFSAGATYGELTARAIERGLTECPLELGPLLRMQAWDEPEADARSDSRHCAPAGAITVASPALDDTDEAPKGFYLKKTDGVLWLRGYWSSSGHVWAPEDAFVFARAASEPSRGG
jgi:hypothetical protein